MDYKGVIVDLFGLKNGVKCHYDNGNIERAVQNLYLAEHEAKQVDLRFDYFYSRGGIGSIYTPDEKKDYSKYMMDMAYEYCKNSDIDSNKKNKILDLYYIADRANNLLSKRSNYQSGIPTLKNLDANLEVKKHRNVYPHVRRTVESYFKQLFEKNDFCMMVPNNVGILSSIAKEHFKSYFEISNNDGQDDYNLRSRLARSIFGCGLCIDPIDREKYGFLNCGCDYDELSHYGSIMFTFKKDRVKDRTTFTYGDSFCQKGRVIASKVTDPKVESAGGSALSSLYNSIVQKFGEDSSGLESGETAQKIDRYIELQYHGDLTIRDVEKVNVGLCDNPNRVANIVRNILPSNIKIETKAPNLSDDLSEVESVIHMVSGESSSYDDDSVGDGLLSWL